MLKIQPERLVLNGCLSCCFIGTTKNSERTVGKLKKYSNEEAFNMVKSILCSSWDPIGLYEKESDWDWEYEGYINPLIKQLRQGRDQAWLESTLKSFVKRMGICSKGTDKKCEITAKELLKIAKLL